MTALVDVVSPAKRSEMMAGIKNRNTKPEVALRKLLHKAGFRFRLNRADLPGRPDIVLPKYRTVIFVHGCFWHGHENCKHFRLPKTRTEFWKGKISGNIARDKRASLELIKLGWKVLIIWECEIPKRQDAKCTLAIINTHLDLPSVKN